MKRSMLLLTILLAMALLCSCAPNSSQDVSFAPTEDIPLAAAPADDPLTPTNALSLIPELDMLQVIILDVGQADCILLKTGSHSMLIDAGNIGQDTLILDYLSKFDVDNLDYLVATHPHADHIGAMAAVIRAMDSIGDVLTPDIPYTTKTFEDLLNVIEEKDIPLRAVAPGGLFALGNAQIQVLAPNSAAYTDLNEYSVVLRVEFGATSFLFAGDAGAKSEIEQLSSGLPLEAEVLKVGHHGSSASSSQEYLDAVNPQYAVISCGEDNSYGYPHSETMQKLNEMDIKVYRTDENGTIIFTSDGQLISVDLEYE